MWEPNLAKIHTHQERCIAEVFSAPTRGANFAVQQAPAVGGLLQNRWHHCLICKLQLTVLLLVRLTNDDRRALMTVPRI